MLCLIAEKIQQNKIEEKRIPRFFVLFYFISFPGNQTEDDGDESSVGEKP